MSRLGRIHPITAPRKLPPLRAHVTAQRDAATVLEQLHEFLQCHRNIAVLTGAGISTASGISDYRGSDGLWKRNAPITWQAFQGDAAMRRRYWARSAVGWPQVAAAKPNPAHLALAQLQAQGRVGAVITQNVDGLHQQAGSREVIDLHGRIDQVRCLSCHARSHRSQVQEQIHMLNPYWQGQHTANAPDGDADIADSLIAAFVPPDCPNCAGILKPHVVFFGENVAPATAQAASKTIETSDALLVIGSSLMVYSSYRLALAAARAQKPIAILTLGQTRADDLADYKWDVDCAVIAMATSVEVNHGDV